MSEGRGKHEGVLWGWVLSPGIDYTSLAQHVQQLLVVLACFLDSMCMCVLGCVHELCMGMCMCVDWLVCSQH